MVENRKTSRDALALVLLLIFLSVLIVSLFSELEKEYNRCIDVQKYLYDKEIMELKRENSKLKYINDSLVSQSPYVIGKVSWYGGNFHGKLMANGEIYDKNGYTAASPLIKGTTKPKYPFGTKLRVENVRNGKSVVVKISDTGSFKNRELDLSKGAFSEIAETKEGV